MVEKKVFSYMEEYHMAAPGERIVAGGSGGGGSHRHIQGNLSGIFKQQKEEANRVCPSGNTRHNSLSGRCHMIFFHVGEYLYMPSPGSRTAVPERSQTACCGLPYGPAEEGSRTIERIARVLMT